MIKARAVAQLIGDGEHQLVRVPALVAHLDVQRSLGPR